MSIRHKYVDPVLLFLGVYAFHFLINKCTELIFIYGYTYLADVLPELVKTHNPISDPDKYTLYLKAVATFGAIACIGIINYISIRLDNKRFELIISKTDGKYEIKDALRIYFMEFFESDLLAASLPLAIFVTSAYFIPEKLLDKGLILIFHLGASLTEYYGLVNALILSIVASIITRMICAPLALRTWRALWLSGSV